MVGEGGKPAGSGLGSDQLLRIALQLVNGATNKFDLGSIHNLS